MSEAVLMPEVADLLREHSQLRLTLLAGPSRRQPIRAVATSDSLAAVSSAAAATVLVVLEHASVGASAYELDVAIRRASDRRLAALVLVGRGSLPVTSASLAERAGLAVLAAAAGRELSELLLGLDRVLTGGAADILARAEQALGALVATEPGGSIDGVLRAVSGALGNAVAYRDSSYREISQHRGAGGSWSSGGNADQGHPVEVRGRLVGRVRADGADAASRLVLPALAATVGRLLEADLSRRFAPAQSRAEILSQVLVAEAGELPALTAQARDLDLVLEHTHLAAWLHLRSDLVDAGAAVASRRRVLDFAELGMLRLLPPRRGLWHVARSGGSLAVVRSERTENPGLAEEVRDDLRLALAGLQREDPAVLVFAGLGTPQRGTDGLRQSAFEARRAADAAEAGGRAGELEVFDLSGLRRLLAEFSSSPLSRRLLADLLAPLDAGGRAASRRSVETLAAYLDSQSSPTRAARVLHLHPNAVAYRMRIITETLGLDLDSADTRLALHVACRARLLDT